jgi:hypothetical protein
MKIESYPSHTKHLLQKYFLLFLDDTSLSCYSITDTYFLLKKFAHNRQSRIKYATCFGIFSAWWLLDKPKHVAYSTLLSMMYRTVWVKNISVIFVCVCTSMSTSKLLISVKSVSSIENALKLMRWRAEVETLRYRWTASRHLSKYSYLNISNLYFF